VTALSHLSDEERHGLADGTLEPERLRDALAHLDSCASCTLEVNRLGALMKLVRVEKLVIEGRRDLWPPIRTRIEATKVLNMRQLAGAGTRARRPWLGIAAAVIAASLLFMAFAELQGWRGRVPIAGRESPAVAFASAADSARWYEQEARRLLNDLEMQRAMMGPAAAAAFDGDLAIIDRSIAEQKAALARDPHNLALQRLLAASYREKVELLRRANNAG
jgi:hypothetical protein